jgi:hypothetical protein
MKPQNPIIAVYVTQFLNAGEMTGLNSNPAFSAAMRPAIASELSAENRRIPGNSKHKPAMITTTTNNIATGVCTAPFKATTAMTVE